MSEVRIKENESLDSALKRWKRSCAKAGTLAEVRKREHYEKPVVLKLYLITRVIFFEKEIKKDVDILCIKMYKYTEI